MTEDQDKVITAFGGRSGNGWIRANCPFCEEKTGKQDQRASMGFNTQTGGYNCFKCATTGMIPEDLLDQVPYMPVAEEAPKVERPPPDLAIGYVPIFQEPFFSSVQYEPARAYLRGRGLRDEVLVDAGVGAAIFGKLYGRIIVPIFNYQLDRDRPVLSNEIRCQGDTPWRGWVSRDYTAWAHKAGLGAPPSPFALERPYMYPKNMDREGLLHGEPALWEETDAPVYVVEGTLDALALWGDAVAVLGKPLHSQVEKLVATKRPVVVVLDGDAHEEGLMLALTLRHLGQRAGNVKLPPRIDPDEVPRADLDAAALRSLDLWGSAGI